MIRLPPFRHYFKISQTYATCILEYTVHTKKKMREFDLSANDSAKELASFALPSFSEFCATTRFDHRVFSAKYNFEPKPCIENPTWFNSTGTYMGRETEQG